MKIIAYGKGPVQCAGLLALSVLFFCDSCVLGLATYDLQPRIVRLLLAAFLTSIRTVLVPCLAEAGRFFRLQDCASSRGLGQVYVD